MVVEKYNSMSEARKRARELRKLYPGINGNIRDLWCFCIVELVYVLPHIVYCTHD